MLTFSKILLASTVLVVAATLLLLSNSVAPVAAWWCQGHMVVAKIAEMHLDPITRESVNANFRYLAATGPFPEVSDMVTGACWADDIKTYKLETMSNWHFWNKIYSVDHFVVPDASCPMQTASSVGVLAGLVTAGKDGFAKPWISSMALAFIVHLYGDIHQPLHNTDMYSVNYTKGDLGGNKINVNFTGVPEVTNLHGFWDAVCGRWVSQWDRPLSGDHLQWLQDQATRIAATYNVSSESANMHDPVDMATESYDLAVSDVYPGAMINDETLTVEYQQKCIPIAEKQLLRAGMRLANTLKFMFKYNVEHNQVPDYIGQLKTALSAGDDHSGEWNGRATGALFGGLILGVILVVAVLMIQKRCFNKDGGNNGNNTGADGYQTVNNGNKKYDSNGFSRGVSASNLRTTDTV